MNSSTVEIEKKKEREQRKKALKSKEGAPYNIHSSE
jgi:uncharacterized protein YjhX (UPF0386 family)